MNEPNQSESISKLAKALSAAQGRMQAVPRNAENPFFKSSYADLSSIIAAARDILAETGLSIVQFGLPTDNGKVALATQLNHISGQWVRGIMMAKPVKDDPQAMGSCVTYLRRYGYSAILGLVQEGEDDDGNQASEGGGKPVKHEPPKQTIAQKHAEVFKTPPATSAGAGVAETPLEKRERFLAMFRPYASAADKVFADHGLVLPTEAAICIDDVKIGNMSVANVMALLEEVKQVHGGKEPPVVSEGDERLPDDLHNPADYTIHPPTDELWRQLIVPFGEFKGSRLGELEKGKLWWWVCVYAPRSWKDKNGRLRDPAKADVEFFNTLKRYREGIIKRYDFTIPDDVPA